MRHLDIFFPRGIFVASTPPLIYHVVVRGKFIFLLLSPHPNFVVAAAATAVLIHGAAAVVAICVAAVSLLNSSLAIAT